jgi:hypothetical protein
MRRLKFRLDRAIVAIRRRDRGISDWHVSNAARCFSLAAYFSQALKIVVQHSRMTNQTHLFRHIDRASADQRATPGAKNLETSGLIRIVRTDLFTQVNTFLTDQTILMLTSFVPVTKLRLQ